MSHFFISYKREDEDFVDVLDERISDEGYTIWRDKRIKAGEEWKQSIDNAIENCIALILVITPHALKSQYVTYEWSYAMGNEKTVIPLILIEPEHSGIHPKLPDRQWINFEQSEEKAWTDLLLALEDLSREMFEFPNSIQNALNDLDKPDAEVRRGAIEALENNDNQLAVEALRQALRHEYLDVRFRGALAFVKRTGYQDFEAIPALKEGLHADDFGNEKHLAAEALGQMSIGEATDILLSLLRDSDARNHIRHALTLSRDPELIEKLYARFDELAYSIVKMRDLNEVSSIIEILAAKNDTNAIERLLKLVDSTEYEPLALIAASSAATLGGYPLVRKYVMDYIDKPLSDENASVILKAVQIISQHEQNADAINELQLMSGKLESIEIFPGSTLYILRQTVTDAINDIKK